MVSYLELDRCKVLPLSLTSFCACNCRPLSKRIVVSKSICLKQRTVFNGSGIALVLTKIGGWVFRLLLGGFLLLFPNPSRIISRKEKQTRYFGHIDVFVTSSAFALAMVLILQGGIPRFAQLSSAMFGLFYCGYFPSFWVKLRCGLAAPALNNRMLSQLPE